MHFVIGSAWWKLTDRLAGATLATFFIAALAFDVYEHFLHRGGNNVFMVLPGEWKLAFEVSVGLLIALEVFGAGLGVRFLKPVE